MTPSHRPLYPERTRAAHRAWTRGLQTGSGGNLSARIPGEQAMIVKSAGSSLGDCNAAGKGWIAVGFDGEPLEGESGSPTKEWRLHAALLRALPETGAVVHTHSVYSISWAQKHGEIPLSTWQSRLKLKTPIPVLDVPAPVVPAESMAELLRLFEQNPALPGFVLRGHGLVALGKTALEAEHTAELIEETAHITLLERLFDRL